jgi:hypothetical protein
LRLIAQSYEARDERMAGHDRDRSRHMAKAIKTAPAALSRIRFILQRTKKGRVNQEKHRPSACGGAYQDRHRVSSGATDLPLAAAYSEGHRLVPARIRTIGMKTVSNFSHIRMMNGRCAYRKIAFS